MEQDQQNKKEENTALQSEFAGKHILVADDQRMNREIARCFLEMTGVEVTLAENGKEALRIIQESSEYEYALIFMDVQMPEMDGCEATRQIRALDREDAKIIPIIAMTSADEEKEILQEKEAGMDDVLLKPVDKNKFETKMREWI